MVVIEKAAFVYSPDGNEYRTLMPSPDTIDIREKWRYNY